MKYFLVLIFVIVSILNVYSQKPSEKGSLDYWIKNITKPLLMPLAAAVYLSFAVVVEPLLLVAFTFGWLGDIALMVHVKVQKGNAIQSTEKVDILPLLLGMGFFFLGHVTYIVLFSKEAVEVTSHLVTYIGVYAVYLLFAFAMFKYLSAHGILASDMMGPKVKKVLKIGICTYMLAITLMSFTALLRYANGWNTAGMLCYIGSLVFISSDSVLSLSMLGQNPKMSERYIMGSYISAQSLIMISYLM